MELKAYFLVVMMFLTAFALVIDVRPTSALVEGTNVYLQGTRSFHIDIQDPNVPNGVAATGTVFYWGVTNEVDLDFDYFIIGVRYERQGGFGNTPSNSLGHLHSELGVADFDSRTNTVYYLAREPIHRTPFPGDTTVTVSGSGGSVSLVIEGNGYDESSAVPESGTATYAGMSWTHTYTKADQDFWGFKEGAVAAKASENDVQEYAKQLVAAQVWLQFTVWNVWTGYVSAWYDVSWYEGGQGVPFYLKHPVEPGGGGCGQGCEPI